MHGTIPFLFIFSPCKMKHAAMSKRIGTAVAFLLAFMTAGAQWNTGSMLRMGQNAIYFDDYVTAIENFNHIIRVKPYLSEPYFSGGWRSRTWTTRRGRCAISRRR